MPAIERGIQPASESPGDPACRQVVVGASSDSETTHTEPTAAKYESPARATPATEVVSGRLRLRISVSRSRLAKMPVS